MVLNFKKNWKKRKHTKIENKKTLENKNPPSPVPLKKNQTKQKQIKCMYIYKTEEEKIRQPTEVLLLKIDWIIGLILLL